MGVDGLTKPRYKLTHHVIDGLTLTLTELSPGKSTRGHSHESQEIYAFFDACKVQVGNQRWIVRPREIVIIPGNKFHRVWDEFEVGAKFVSVYLGSWTDRKATYK